MTRTAHDDLCSDCPREGHPTDTTRCQPCPRRRKPTTILERITGRETSDGPEYGPSNTGG